VRRRAGLAVGVEQVRLVHLVASAHTIARTHRGGAGPGAEPARGAGRINQVLTGTRGFLICAVDQGAAPAETVRQLYELADSRHLPTEARGEDGAMRLRLRTRHRVQEPTRPVDRATDVEAVRLLRACLSARERFLVILLGRAGLRRSEAAGLRREDLHFLPDSSGLGCSFPGSHLHVVRRDNVNGAWAKSRRERAVPVDWLVVQAHDQYVLERAERPGAEESDFVLVNLFRPPVGVPMKPDAIGERLAEMSRRAGLDRVVHPHLLRHAFASNVLDAGGSLDEVQDLLGH
jgi:integrase/recombinase XerD